MEQSVLITGAGGFLGTRAAAFLAQNGWKVTACTHKQLDLTDEAAVHCALTEVRPSAVVHCAAISDTGYTQAHPEQARAVGVDGTAHLARACAQGGAKLLYMSSDQVYNGCLRQGPLAETEPLAPESVYGALKWETEQRVAALLPDAVGLRLSWMYDLPRVGCKTSANLLTNLLRAGMRGEALSFAVREERGVTWIMELVRAIPALLSLPGGVYNAGSASVGTTYGAAVLAAKALGCEMPERLVRPDEARFSAHVRNLAMNCDKLAAHGIVFPDTAKGIEACLAAYGWAHANAKEEA